MKLPVYDQKAKKSTKSVDIDDKLVAGKINDRLLAQYVYVFLSNQREAIAHAKDRSEVSGGGRKPWRQKGTGRARHGSNRSPIWTGGGVTFGPTKERNWKKDISRKMRRAAIRSALAKLVSTDSFKIVDKIELSESQLTKQAIGVVEAFGSPRKVTIVTGEYDPKLVKSFSNIPGARVQLVSELNAYDLINAGEVIMMQSALDYLQKWI